MCGERATFLAWTKDSEITEADIQHSCTQHLAKAVRAAHEASGGAGYVRVVPVTADTRVREPEGGEGV